MDRVIYCFWTGDNEMSSNRYDILSSISAITGCRLEFITPDTLPNWIRPNAPLHPAYEYLSAVHRTDYLRCYFMHHYGGGYTDIKLPTGSWLPAFLHLDANPDCWAVGYAEDGPGAIAHVPDVSLYRQMQAVFARMLGNGAYICRPQTPLTTAWMTELHRVLDQHLPVLQLHPAPHPRAHAPADAPYPIRWTEICGNIFHPTIHQYLDHVTTTLPKPVFHDYM